MILKWIASFFGMAFLFCTHAQIPRGLPEMIAYEKNQLGAGTQNWKIRQGKEGLIYVANNEGLLCYDGYRWTLFSVPGGGALRSLEVSSEGILYAGGVDEFGYFIQSEAGRFTFHSLKEYLPVADRSFSDIWAIVEFEGAIFFRSSTRIFRWSKGNMTVYKGTQWRYLGKFNGNLIAQDQKAGLLQFEAKGWTGVAFSNQFDQGEYISAIIQTGKDSGCIITQNDGIFSLSNNKVSAISNPRIDRISTAIISAATILDNQKICIVTRSDGLFILDQQYQLLEHYTREEGLQNNHIITVFADAAHNLWLGLENGIDFIAYSSPIRKLYPDLKDIGSGYAMAFLKNRLYLGTANGLYQAPVQLQPEAIQFLEPFQKVEGSKGQVWNLNIVNNTLFMAHHEGAFKIEKDKALSIDRNSGYWTFQAVQDLEPSDEIMSSSYKGFTWFDFNRSAILKRQSMWSVRCVEKTNQYFWASHPSKGLSRKLRWNAQASFEPYQQKSINQPGLNPFIFNLAHRLILATNAGIYQYNEPVDSFIPSEELNKIFKNKPVQYFKDDGFGKIWFVSNGDLGYLTGFPDKTQVQFLPEFSQKTLKNFEMIGVLPNQMHIIGGESGFYLLNTRRYLSQEFELRPRIMQVVLSASADSVIFEGNGTFEEDKEISIHPGWSSLQFQFSAPYYGHQANIEYAVQLDGYDAGWSSWSKKTEKEYTNLPPGTYQLQVKARNAGKETTQTASFAFEVLPKWYQTIIFKVALGFAGIGLLLFAYREYKKKMAKQLRLFQKEQERQRVLQQLEMDKAEKELIQLQNEKLETELEYKNSELASSAMHLVQKAEFLGKLRDELKQLVQNPSSEQGISGVRKLIKSLGEADRIDAEWDVFAQHFDQVHKDFLSNIRHLYPQLSPNELKLCAYLRINLSTKEIAQLLNISVRGVEISRYRLRKKLDIPHGESLYNFLNDIKDQEP